MRRLFWMALIACSLSGSAIGQQPVLSTTPMQAVYEYQLNYQLPWQQYYGGPGLSLGGTMPTQGVSGYSSLNGLPLPPPLGAGVYINGAPTPYGMGLPYGIPYGLPYAMPYRGPFGLRPLPVMPGGVPFPAMMGPVMPPLATTMSLQSPSAQQLPAVQQPQAPIRALLASAPGARRMSMEQQNLGDAKLRDQKWTQAYVNYRNAVDVAPERPEAHFRLAMTFAAMKQYASAVREFKRSLDLDPTLPQSGDKLSTILGADSKVVQTAILPDLADWAREDLTSTDRLFVLGLVLYFDDDPRGSEMLEAALRTEGAKDYVQLFLNPATSQPDGNTPTPPPSAPAPASGDKKQPVVPDDSVPPAPTLFPPAPPLEPIPNPPPS